MVLLDGFIIKEFLNSPMTLRLCGQVASAVKNQNNSTLPVGVYYFLTETNTMKIFNLVRR
jgi:hypothetical protein